MTPTQRTLKLFRDQGWTCCVVEKWNRFARVRQDAFGFGDILCFREPFKLPPVDHGPQGKGVALIQATTREHESDRVKKVTESPHFKPWLEAGGRIFVVTWAKRGARGKRKTWQHFVTELHGAIKSHRCQSEAEFDAMRKAIP